MASFVAIATNDDITCEIIFEGKLDHTDFLQQTEAYDCFVEAREAMAKTGCKIQLIGELNVPKEKLAEAKKIGKYTN